MMNQLSRIQTTLNIIFYFSSLLLLCSANMYFINCGSNTNVHLSDSDDRIFEGDLNSSAVTFTKHGSTVEQAHPSHHSNGKTLSLYQTARVFKKNSCYNFDIKDKGIYILRIHFFAFSSSASSQKNLSDARFGVAASSTPKQSKVFSLFSDFNVEKNINSSEPLIAEFSLYIEVGKFAIYFIPDASSFAFVNAIEVFLPAQDIFPNAHEGIQPLTSSDSVQNLNVLHTVYRINAGGSEIQARKDGLWNRWVRDDSFLVDPNNTETKSQKVTSSDVKFVPDAVFQDARVMKTDLSNISWSFGMRKNIRHFVRAYFYDVVSFSPQQVNFNISFNNFSVPSPAGTVPEFQDFIVDSVESEFLNISLIPNPNYFLKSAYLNGLEIMEMSDKLIPEPPITRDRIQLVYPMVGAVVCLIIVCILVFVFFLVRRRRKLQSSETFGWINLQEFIAGSTHGKITNPSTHSHGLNLNLGLKISLAEIKLATKYFDKKMIIGKGGFGNVYKGTLRGGKVAVKRSNPDLEQGLSEFQTEIVMLSKIRHKHLVSLVGYCDESSEMILVYEYVEKGTLREHLYGSNLPSLSWKQRLEICIGAARGMHYLHSGFSGGIIHRDVKSTNILLDENYVAKVADFGLSKSGFLDQTHVMTGVKGTFGYLDPEYFMSEQLTEKSDVYSFGVVLLEVLCARQPIDISLPKREQINLAEWGIYHMKKGLLREIVDPFLSGQINHNSLRKFGEIATKCLEDCSADRPSMGEVLYDLEYALLLQQTSTHGEPNSESLTIVSSELYAYNAEQFSSFSSAAMEGHLLKSTDDDTELGISDVFSELKNEDAR